VVGRVQRRQQWLKHFNYSAVIGRDQLQQWLEEFNDSSDWKSSTAAAERFQRQQLKEFNGSSRKSSTAAADRVQRQHLKEFNGSS